ncbi:MAG: DUF2505 domain-containing protein [Myxococcota bacterium]
MKLYVEDHLPAPPSVVWEVFESDDYKERYREETGDTLHLLERRIEGDVEIQRIRNEPNRELPGIVARALGAKKLTFTQTNRLNLTESRMEWEVKLDVLTDMVTVKGTTSCIDVGDGTRRVIDGEIKVKVPMLGGQIERLVVGEFEKSMRRAVDIALEMLEER